MHRSRSLFVGAAAVGRTLSVGLAACGKDGKPNGDGPPHFMLGMQQELTVK